MKRLLLLLALFISAQARYAKIEANLALTVVEDAPRQLNAELVRLCAQETNLSLQELQQFHSKDFSNVTEATQCFTHCLYEQLGLMHDGIFVEQDFIDRLTKLSNPSWWPQRDCHLLRGGNKCETAYKIHQCKQNLKIPDINIEANQNIEETSTTIKSATKAI